MGMFFVGNARDSPQPAFVALQYADTEWYLADFKRTAATLGAVDADYQLILPGIGFKQDGKD